MSKTKKLSKKDESALCLACGECCKRYWITVLPEEATKISRLTKSQKKDFLEKDCVLHVKLYPKTTPGVLTFPSTFIPKRIFDLLRKQPDNISDSYFVVPQVVLKRDQAKQSFAGVAKPGVLQQEKTVFNFRDGRTKTEKRDVCTFLAAENKCAIYEARPEPCKLFPFIAVPGFLEQYPFCALYQETEKNLAVESKIYYQKIQSYFKKVHNFGFSYMWRTPPKKGLIYLQDTLLGEITLNELEQMMPSND